MIKITFPDGSVREYAKGTTAYQIAESISPRLAADSLAAAVNGATVDMTRPIEEDASVKFYKWDDEEGKHAFWHTSSHLLAEALEALYPGIKFGIGPAIENGFYYDVDSPTPITEADLPTIENKMVELSRNKEALLRREVPKAEALKTFTEKGDQYKVELITDLEDGTISFYTNGAFTDLCRGPHIPNTGYIKALKAYLGSRCLLARQREEQDADAYLRHLVPQEVNARRVPRHVMEEAKKRDHRKLGKDLELFTFSQRGGPGTSAVAAEREPPCATGWSSSCGASEGVRIPAGHHAAYRQQGALRHLGPLRQIRQGLVPADPHPDRGRGVPAQTDELPAPLRNLPLETPFVQGVARTSGEVRYGLPLRAVGRAPRTDPCPRVHAGRRPPLRSSGPVSRRVRDRVIDIVLYIFKTLKFDSYTAQISLRDPNNKEKYIGSDENWEKAESAIMQAAKEKGLNTVVEYGEAAFYGPETRLHGQGTPSAASGSWERSRWTTTFRSVSTSPLKGADDKSPPPDHDPPCAVRLDGAFRGRLAGAYGRQVPAVALAAAGCGTSDFGEVQRLVRSAWPTT